MSESSNDTKEKRLQKIQKGAKKFVHGRLFPAVIVIVFMIALIGLLFWNGFRITYAPELENNWDAISSVATWAGVVVSLASAAASFAAIWFAIRVADKQNKIALFERRWSLYKILYDWYHFSEQIILCSVTQNNEARDFFAALFNNGNTTQPFLYQLIERKYRATLEGIEQISFVFLIDFESKEVLKKFIEVNWKVLMGNNQTHIEELKQVFNSEEIKKIIDVLKQELSIAKLR